MRSWTPGSELVKTAVPDMGAVAEPAVAAASASGAGTDAIARARRGSGPLRRFLAHRPAVAGLVVFLVLVLVSFVGQYLWRYDYTDLTGDYSQPPSLAHPFGTDSVSHDLFAQVLRGTSRSIQIALFVAVVSTILGAVVGAVAGYYRGFADSGLMRLVDLVLTLPLYAIAALLGHQVGSGRSGWLSIALV